ncbi:hypothetical protein [Marinicella meishanensis]|uniref:hypothetical protein n=1 Tax=Marinicella meishanensis TaxID=2873263 RepID=UPI001CBF2FC8|nr:hypothetical protein [Marinicella sp. NBU2979]
MKTTPITVAWRLACWLITATTAAASQAERMTADQMAMAELEYAQWFNQLNEHLLQSDDSHEMALGLAAMLNSSLQAVNRHTDQAANQDASDAARQQAQQNLALQINLLNQMIQRNDLSKATMELLRNWCFKDAIAKACNHGALLDQQLTEDTKNLQVYWQPLTLSLNQQNEALTERIMQLMAASQFNHATLFISESFNDKLDQYLAANPIPDSAIDAFMDDQALLSDLQASSAADLRTQVAAYFPASIKLSYVHLFDTPNPEPLYQLCKTQPKHFKACLNITQILINQSNTIRHKGLGYAMLMAMHEAQGNQELLQTVQQTHNRFKEQVACLNAASRSESLIGDFLDPKFQEINLLPIDEIKKLELLAKYMHEKHKLTDRDHRDPQTCYLEKP